MGRPGAPQAFNPKAVKDGSSVLFRASGFGFENCFCRFRQTVIAYGQITTNSHSSPFDKFRLPEKVEGVVGCLVAVVQPARLIGMVGALM